MGRLALEEVRPAGDFPAAGLCLAPVEGIPDRVPQRYRRAIEATCSRPEMRFLAAPVTFVVDENLCVPFRIMEAGGKVHLAPDSLTNRAVAALHIRHALELALWQRLVGDGGTTEARMAVGLLALRVASLYWGLLTDRERAACQPLLPGWLRNGLQLMSMDALLADHAALAARAVSQLSSILQLQGAGGAAAPDELDRSALATLLRDVFSRAGTLAAPAEHLLMTGADDRLGLEPATGLNRYGCSPRPRPWALAFASSTASSISELAYQEVERLRQRMIMAALADELPSAFAGAVEQLRRAILAACGVGGRERAEVILTASGTDAELYALCFALWSSAEGVVNVVVGPDETGTGALHAAAGRHFSFRSALGVPVERGAAIEGLPERRVWMETIAVRDGCGAARAVADIDREVAEVVEGAIAAGRRCLVHLLDSSKTGLGGPSSAALQSLQDRHRSTIDVVVDACQMRVGPEALRAYLQAGFMVMVTASKFFTAPPFAGALVLPEAIAARVRDMQPLPAGFAVYTSRPDWPAGWDGICRHLPDRRNFGLLFRWRAGLWEMQAFDAVPPEERRRILLGFARSVRHAIEAGASVALVDAPVPDRGRPPGEGAWDDVQTIFSFLILRETAHGARVPLDLEDAKRVHEWLNLDISSLLPAAASERERMTAARECHIGQPVRVSACGDRCVGALRMSADARLVSAVMYDRALGETLAARLGHETKKVRLVLEKVDLITKYFDCLCQIA